MSGTPAGGVGPRHPSIKRLRRLSRRRSSRTEEGRFVVDGPILLAEALDAGVRVDEVIVESGAPLPPDLAPRALAAGAALLPAAPGVLAGATDTVTPQPVAAVARLEDRSPADAAAAAGPLALVLVGVADPGNAGTLLRSAEAAGAGAVLFCDSSVDPYGPKAVRSSAGSVFRLAVVRDVPVGEALAALRAEGVASVGTVVAGEGPGGAAPVPYDAVDWARPVALVLGNEAHGLGAGVTADLDVCATIPMAGRTESLNVAMAGTVLCFESLRQRRARAAAGEPAEHAIRMDAAPRRQAGSPDT